ncbi:PREDICTED: HEAT repeat-containing protein 6 isoform X3 [Nicotiana attenuata]|uniref:HEAT repeat-containing protein 6 isoform X3 n=1 Tax=Nicotiana attenuata TaxID=49451 RepID=UPI0009053477|nr:PREDICTED: HEAT repeat-containing protein 6 isoform X3 [Nicotiana attenuata]
MEPLPDLFSRFYTSLLHCLHLVLTDAKGSLSGHVAGLVVALRNFIHYGLTNKSHDMFAIADKKQITSVSMKPNLAESTKSQAGRYRPPHLRNNNLKNLQLEDEKSLTLSSDSENSDSDGSGRVTCNTPYAKTRLAAIICIQDLCLADPKSFTAQWTMLLPSSDVLPPRRYEATLMSCLLFDPYLKARVAAASAIRAMLDAPSSVFLQVAEFKESAKCGSFMALSSSLGQILMQLHSGTLYLIKRETHSGLLASLFKILMLLLSSTPYSRMPRELLPTVLSSIQARIEEGFLFRSDQNILLATAINCLSAALSVSPFSVDVRDMLVAEASAGFVSSQSKSGILSTLFRYCEPGVSPSVGFEALQAVRSVAHNYPSVMVLCWEKISLLVNGFLTFSPETRSWRDNVGNLNEPIGEKVITASIKVLDECLRAISGFKGTEDLSSDISLDSPFTSDYVKLKTISSAPSYGPHDCAVNNDGAEKLSGSEQWLEAIVRHLPLISQHSSPMVRAASVTCFAGITSTVFFSLPKDKQDFILSSCVKTARSDEVPNVRSAACRAIGVIACFPHIFQSAELFDKFISPAVHNSNDSSISVRITASWALANICDALRHHVDVHEFENFSSAVSSRSISLLMNCALHLTNDNDKVKANAVRALGNLARVVRFSSRPCAYDRQADSMVVSSEGKPTKDLSVCEDLGGCSSAHNTPLENFKWLEKMVQAFISCVTTGNVKVQWNVCYSLSNLFSNPTLKLENMVWASSVFSILLLLLRDSSNFKIRIQAAAALAVPASSNDYGGSFFSVLQGVQHVVESLSSDEISSPSNLKYRLALEKQLTSTMLHLLGLTSKNDDRHVHEFLMKKSSFLEEWFKLVCMSLEKSPNQFEAEYYSSVNHKKDVIFRAIRSLIEVYEAHDLHAVVQRFHKLSNIL